MHFIHAFFVFSFFFWLDVLNILRQHAFSAQIDDGAGLVLALVGRNRKLAAVALAAIGVQLNGHLVKQTIIRFQQVHLVRIVENFAFLCCYFEINFVQILGGAWVRFVVEEFFTLKGF